MTDDRVVAKLASLEATVAKLSEAVAALGSHAAAAVRGQMRPGPDTPEPVDHFTVASGITLEALEAAYLLHVLESCGHNKTQAAAVLGVDPSTLYRKLTRLGW